jgi:hypothetical protein
MPLFQQYQATIIKKNIQGGFRGAGLAPLNANHVISKLDIKLRTPTPPIEEFSLPAPWTPKTPKTIRETESHSEYLKRRIERHHSSSPASIIEAVKSMTKGAKAILHRMALLESEVKDLREANTILSRRRREKNKRLRNGGMMTVEEGQGLIDQMDVNTQIMAESSRAGGQGRSVQSRERRCGVCGKPGHNARTCKIEVEASGQEYRD